MKDLKYTGRITDLGTGPIPDAFDQNTIYNVVDVNIPMTDREDKNLRLYIKGLPNQPIQNVVDIELVESFGIVDSVKSIETEGEKYRVNNYDFIEM